MEQIRNPNEFKDSKLEKVDEISKQLIDTISSGDINEAMRMKDEYNISDDVINSSDVQSVAKKAMLHALPKGHDYVNDAFLFSGIFNIPEEDILNITQKAIENEELAGRKNNAILIKEKFNINE